MNAALDGLTYRPPAGFEGRAHLTITCNDGGHTGPGGPAQDTDTVTIQVGGTAAQAREGGR